MIHFHRSRSGKLRLPLGRYLVLALLMLYLSSATTYGNYISQAGGSDSVQVAKFAVTITPETTAANPKEVTISNDGTDEATYTVTFKNNGSEVTVQHRIEITNIPAGVTVSMDNGSYQKPNSNQVTFDCGELESGTQTHTLRFKASDGTATVTGKTITIKGFAEQVD